jgi:translation initiation factor IF-2
MSTMVAELYDALRKAGVDQQLAQRAACAVLPADVRMDLATKSDLLALRADVSGDLSDMKRELSELKVELIKWNVGAMAVLTAIFAAIVRLG